ncbi:MAG: sodium:solute symporter family protein [Candidatus Krumholzibacteriota bacterium]
MQLDSLDWLVVVVCLVAAFAPALWFARRASRGTAEFFASGRTAPWWLIGTSMVATTFSTDTPNLVTDLVRSNGVAANWSWWAFLITGMATVFLYARLWRRSGALTDLEFYEMRYSGRLAAVVRGVRAVYLGLVFNAVIMATVTLAAVKIAHVLLGWDRGTTLVVCFLLSVGFSALAGLWGVLVADLVQFAIAMIGVIAAARAALQAPQVGGLTGLVDRLDPQTLAFFPDPGDGTVFVSVLVVPLAVQWWAVWYPGAEPGGGSYIAQRMLAARDENHALKAVLWFNVAHYALRPWPWILVALASLLVFPELSDIRAALPHVDPALLGNDIAYPAMLTLLPHGLLGLLVASLTSAYVSTMSTHLNWGASYLVNDLYRRFLRPDADERHLVRMSRLVTVGLMGCAAGFTLLLETAGEAFRLLLSFGAGTGLIYLLRWYWWRINAWSEISAMIVSFLVTISIHLLGRADVIRLGSDATLLWTVGITTFVWLAVTFMTPPVDRTTLAAFVRRVRPAGPGWPGFTSDDSLPADNLPRALLSWSLGCLSIYAALFAIGSFLYGYTARGSSLGVLAVVAFLALNRFSRGPKDQPPGIRVR